MGSSPHRFGIAVSRDLSKDRRYFKHGHRVEQVVIANDTDTNRKFEIDPFDRYFYIPSQDVSGGEYLENNYFYLNVLARDSQSVGPFFAPRGLVVRGQGPGGNNCFATVTVHIEDEKDLKKRDL